MFQFHRIYCATPWELEPERYRFHDLTGLFNETFAMQEGILFVPVSLGNIRDKRPLQYTIDENIRECIHYLLVLWDNWGPVERNFRNEYHYALQCAADPALPMRSVAVVAKRQPSGEPLAEGLPEPLTFFSTMAEFDSCVNGLLADWLASLLAS